MAELGTIVQKVRSKNAGPFWLTIDIFCGSPDAFQLVSKCLETKRIAQVFAIDTQQIKRFDLENLNVIKFSFPRPFVQGSIHDPDMHGASWAALLAELEI